MAEIAKTFYRYSTFLQRMMELFDDGSVMYSEIESRRKHEYLPNRYYDKFVEGMNKLFENGCIDVFLHIQETAKNDSLYAMLYKHCENKIDELVNRFEEIPESSEATKQQTWKDSLKVETQSFKDNSQNKELKGQVRGRKTNNGRG